MSRHAWYRNTDWNAKIETEFFARLGRARQKTQYLRVQAYYVADRHPQVALRLLDQYFGFEAPFDLSQAYVQRAEILLSLGDTDGALDYYDRALATEKMKPNYLTGAYLALPLLIAEKKIQKRYAQALQILDETRARPRFPRDRFLWNGARAVIHHELGQIDAARDCARKALAAADEKRSWSWKHPELGLVGAEHADFLKELARIAA